MLEEQPGPVPRESAAPSEPAGGELPLRYWRRRGERFALLQEWYGTERAEREIAAHTAQPRPVGKAVERLIAGLKRPETGELLFLTRHWAEITGPVLGRFTVPESLRDGVLTIRVRHSALLQELRPGQALLLKKINEYCSTNYKELRLLV